MLKFFNRKNIIIIVLLLITIASVAVTIFLLNRDTQDIPDMEIPLIAPEFAPDAADKNAAAVEGGNSEKLKAPEGGGAVSLTYTDRVTIDLSRAEAKFTFINPLISTQDLILQLVILSGDEKIVVAQSGLIPAGYSLDTMPVQSISRLGEGYYTGQYNVVFYDPVTKKRAGVNTVIPVDIVAKSELSAG